MRVNQFAQIMRLHHENQDFNSVRPTQPSSLPNDVM
jgi:hypothetical protein